MIEQFVRGLIVVIPTAWVIIGSSLFMAGGCTRDEGAITAGAIMLLPLAVYGIYQAGKK